MELIQAIIAALSLFTASPEVHNFFEHAPQGSYQSIPIGAHCGPSETLDEVVASFNPPEAVVETVQVDDNVRLHLSRALTNHTSYTVFVEYVAQNIVCAVEIQGESGDAI